MSDIDKDRVNQLQLVYGKDFGSVCEYTNENEGTWESKF